MSKSNWRLGKTFNRSDDPQNWNTEIISGGGRIALIHGVNSYYAEQAAQEIINDHNAAIMLEKIKKEKTDSKSNDRFVLEVPLVVSYDPRRLDGNIISPARYNRMAFADMIATVKDGKKEIGSIRGCLGMGVEFMINDDGRTFYVGPQALWNAFVTMMNRKDLVMI